MEVTEVHIGLGSNLGRARVNLARAVRAMRRLPGVGLARLSRVYVTEPQENPDQPWFANQVAVISCDASWTPGKLLSALQDIEARGGRDRSREERFGPRVIDLDILLYGGLIQDQDGLILPHPRLRRRAFVLVPLLEVSPDLLLPDGESAREAAAEIAFQVAGNVIRQGGESGRKG